MLPALPWFLMADSTSPVSLPSEYRHPREVFVVQPSRPRYWLHALLLLLTFYTTLIVGARLDYNFHHNLPAFYEGEGGPDFFPYQWTLEPARLVSGIPFSFSLMLILLAHEMGHYLYCRHYRVWATMPFFIPCPTLFGTLGAFIRIRSPIRSRDALFDIGIAGPIAGFVVATAVLWISLALSHGHAPFPTEDSINLNYPLIFYILHAASGAGRLPLGQLALHPMAIAAWIGMFATALNLLPGGQLDGGHIVFSLAPGAHRAISRAAIVTLLVLAYFCWAGWIVWAIMLAISGMRHPVVPLWPGVGKKRWLVAVCGLLLLALTFAPAPVQHASLPEASKGLGQQFRQMIYDWRHHS